MSAELKGFWSYVRRDDAALGGVITRLSEHVVDEYDFKRGDGAIDLFRDTAKVRWGDIWRDNVREAIQDGAFFIPIVTPRFLTSEECRNELLEFAEQERELGREGLIMPLYFADVAAIESKDDSDPVVRILLERHREDWRERRLLDRSVQPYRKAVSRLVDRLVEIAESRPQETVSGKGDDAEGGEDTEPGGRPADGQDLTPGTILSGPMVTTDPSTSEAPGGWALEQLAEGEDAVPHMVETLGEIAPVLESVGELTQASTAELDKGNSEGMGFKGRLAIANRLAEKLAGPASRLQELTSQYTTDLEIVDPAMIQLIDLAGEQYEGDPEEAEEFFAAVAEMIDGSEKAAEQIAEMINAMETPANFSRELSRPITTMRGSLQSMLDADEVIRAWREHIARARKDHPGGP